MFSVEVGVELVFCPQSVQVSASKLRGGGRIRPVIDGGRRAVTVPDVQKRR